MKQFKILVVSALLALAAFGLAQSDGLTVTGTKPTATLSVVLTDATGTDLGAGTTTYALGQLNNSSFTYGGEFLIYVTYDNVPASVALAISGSQTNYSLAYKFLAKSTLATASTATYTEGVAFGSLGSAAVAGSAANQIAQGDRDATPAAAFNSFTTVTGDATKFAVGAKSSAAASVNLGTTVTITATAN
jgi:hypothetical protein